MLHSFPTEATQETDTILSFSFASFPYFYYFCSRKNIQVVQEITFLSFVPHVRMIRSYGENLNRRGLWRKLFDVLGELTGQFDEKGDGTNLSLVLKFWSALKVLTFSLFFGVNDQSSTRRAQTSQNMTK